MLRLRPTFAAGVRLVLALLVASASPVSVRSYVASPEGPNGGGGVDQVRSAAERAVVASAAADDLMDRFDGVEADLILTVGRTPDTAMPPEWASSGAKLGLTVGVRFTSRPASSDLLGPEGEGLLEGDEGTGEEEGAGGGGGGGAAAGRRRRRRPSSPAVRSVVPTNVPSFTGAGGVEAVAVTEGGYACRIQRVATGQRSFRFFLDFPEGARRNDVVLPAERIYFMTAYWSDDDGILERARLWKDDLRASLEELDDADARPLDEAAAGRGPAGGSRPADGPFRRVATFRRRLARTRRKRELEARVEALDEAFPPEDRLEEGPNGVTFLKEGAIAVKRRRGGEERYHWVGTFAMRRVFRRDGGEEEEEA